MRAVAGYMRLMGERGPGVCGSRESRAVTRREGPCGGSWDPRASDRLFIAPPAQERRLHSASLLDKHKDQNAVRTEAQVVSRSTTVEPQDTLRSNGLSDHVERAAEGSWLACLGRRFGAHQPRRCEVKRLHRQDDCEAGDYLGSDDVRQPPAHFFDFPLSKAAY